MRVGIVVPALNENEYIDRCIRSLIQRSASDVDRIIVVVDGMSEDGTRKKIEDIRTEDPSIVLLDNPMRITPVAFNIGVKYCLEHGCELICIVSAHASVFEDTIENAVKRYRDGFLAFGMKEEFPRPENLEEEIVQVVYSSPIGGGGARRRFFSSPIRTDTPNFPCLAREVYEKVGFFKEDLVRNQDNEFAARVRQAGFDIWAFPEVRATYYFRKTIPSFLRLMRNNGRYIFSAMQAHRHSHSIRHFAPVLALSVGVALLFLGLVDTFFLYLLEGLALTYVAFLIAGAVHAAIAFHARWSSLHLLIVVPLAHLMYAWGSIEGVLGFQTTQPLRR